MITELAPIRHTTRREKMSSRHPLLRNCACLQGWHRRVVTVVSILLMMAVVTPMGAAQASTRIATCFSYGGQRWQGVSTYLEYFAVDNRWHPLNGTQSFSRSNGCIAYYPSSAYRGYSFRVHAAALVPNWRGVFNGVSPTYAPGGNGSYNLGETNLNFHFIPASWPTEPSRSNAGLTSDWLEDMAQGCRTLAALPRVSPATWTATDSSGTSSSPTATLTVTASLTVSTTTRPTPGTTDPCSETEPVRPDGPALARADCRPGQRHA